MVLCERFHRAVDRFRRSCLAGNTPVPRASMADERKRAAGLLLDICRVYAMPARSIRIGVAMISHSLLKLKSITAMSEPFILRSGSSRVLPHTVHDCDDSVMLANKSFVFVAIFGVPYPFVQRISTIYTQRMKLLRLKAKMRNALIGPLWVTL